MIPEGYISPSDIGSLWFPGQFVITGYYDPADTKGVTKHHMLTTPSDWLVKNVKNNTVA